MCSNLRIVFVAPFGLRHKSTVWARSLPLAQELTKLGHQASILVPPWDSPEDAGSRSNIDGVAVEHVRLAGGVAATSHLLMKRIRSLSPHIVHIIKPRAYAGIVQWLLWQSRRIGADTPRIVLDIDDWERPWAVINGYPQYQAVFLQWQEEWGVRHADGIVAASRWLYEKALSASPTTPVEFLPNGVTPRANAVGRDYALRSPPRVLLLSRFVEASPAWVGQFWHHLQLEAQDVVLLVAGRALHSNGEAPFLQALSAAAKSAKPANAAWLGYIGPDELPHLYDAVDCAVFPSLDTPMHRAKCSVRMAGVLHHGVPAIASAVGAQAVYGANGAAALLPPECDPAEFAQETARVLSSEPVRQTYGETAAERMNSEYAWPVLAGNLSRFYLRILNDRTERQ